MVNERAVFIGFKYQTKHVFDETLARQGGTYPFRKSKGNFKTFPWFGGPMIAKYSPLFPILNGIMIRLIEGDIVEQITRSYCYFYDDFIEDDLAPFNLQHMTIALGIIAFGLLVSTIAFGIELIMHKY